MEASPPQASDSSHGATPARWVGQGPLCALCAGPGAGDVAEHHLTHGITVQLCRHHRSERFRHDDGGNEFVRALETVWRAAGCLTRRRCLALDAHTRRITPSPAGRRLPGSYSWPGLRQEAERRWAAGHPPNDVIHELRQLHAGATAVVPSQRTMRRWFDEARWTLAPPRNDPPGRGERMLAWVAEQNRQGQQFGGRPLPGWPDVDRHGRPYRRR